MFLFLKRYQGYIFNFELTTLIISFFYLYSNFCKLENQTHSAGSAEAEKGIEVEEAEWQESLIQIKQWNDEVALKRNDRLQLEKEAKKVEIETRMREEEERQAQRLKEINEIIRKEKVGFLCIMI